MSKKKTMILASVVLVLILFIAAKAYLKPSNDILSAGYKNTGLKTQYNKLIESGKPSMVIFSYDADC